MDDNTSSFIDGLLNEIADRVIKRISENNSTWLNNIQYKVKAENVEGLDDAIRDGIMDNKDHILEWASDVAEATVKDLEFDITVR
jgi:hypothetical protein